jgi:IS605 OrfB family transposase
VNHCISKGLVAKAKDTGRGIAVEDLEGIRDRTQFRKPQRFRVGGWAFFQLRQFITYKATLAGVVVVAVDPRNTSRTCSKCGHCEKANRKSQGEFECKGIGPK